MCDNGNGNGPTPAQASAPAPSPESGTIVIRFRERGSAEFQLETENVSPVQLLGVATWLDWFARRQFDAAATQQPRIAVPKVSVPRGHA